MYEVFMFCIDAAQVGKGVDHHHGALHPVDPHQDDVEEVAPYPIVGNQDLSADQEGRNLILLFTSRHKTLMV